MSLPLKDLDVVVSFSYNVSRQVIKN